MSSPPCCGLTVSRLIKASSLPLCGWPPSSRTYLGASVLLRDVAFGTHDAVGSRKLDAAGSRWLGVAPINVMEFLPHAIGDVLYSMGHRPHVMGHLPHGMGHMPHGMAQVLHGMVHMTHEMGT